MSQQLRVTRRVDFTGAEQIGIGNGFTNRGKVYYVLGGEAAVLGSDSYDGKSWSYPKATITNALATIAAAPTNEQVWNTIVVGCNTSATYLEGATLTLSNMGTKLFGAMTSGQTWGVPSIHTHGTETLLIIEAHACEVAYIGFHDQGAGISMEVGHADGAWWRNHIHDCYFGGNDTALWAIAMGNHSSPGPGIGDAHTVDTPTTIVEDCYFGAGSAGGYATGNVFFNCGYGSTVRRCTFTIGTAACGIRYETDSTSRPYAFIKDNAFTTSDASNAYGIVVTNTPTAGYLMVDGNRFLNFPDGNHCCSKRTGYMGLNYTGITALGVATE